MSFETTNDLLIRVIRRTYFWFTTECCNRFKDNKDDPCIKLQSIADRNYNGDFEKMFMEHFIGEIILAEIEGYDDDEYEKLYDEYNEFIPKNSVYDLYDLVGREYIIPK